MSSSAGLKKIIRISLVLLIALQLLFSAGACTNAHEAELPRSAQVSSAPEMTDGENIGGTDDENALPGDPGGESSEETPEPSATPSPAPTPVPEKSEGEKIAEFALQFEGYDYVYGGRSPVEGFDCSGLIYYVFREFGYKLYRVAADQATMGEHVEYEDLMPGDILCFRGKWDSTIGHVGLYIGDGIFLQAMDSLHGVVLWELDNWLEGRVLEARRLAGILPKYTQEELLQLEIEEEEAIANQKKIDEWNAYMQQQMEALSASVASADAAAAPQESAPDPRGDNIAYDDTADKYRLIAEQEEAERLAAEQAAQEAGEAAGDEYYEW